MKKLLGASCLGLMALPIQAGARRPAELAPQAAPAAQAAVAAAQEGGCDIPFATLEVEGISTRGGELTVGGARRLSVGTGRLGVAGGTLRLAVSEGTAGTIVGGNMYVLDDASLVTTSDWRFQGTTISALGSHFRLAGTTTILGASVLRSGERSTISVTGGNILFTDDSTLSSEGSSLSVTGGNIILRDYSVLRATDTSMALERGALTLFDDATVVFSGATITIRGGDISLSDNSTMTLSDSSSLQIGGGNLELQDDTTLRLDEGSTIQVRGGDLSMPDGALSAADLADLDLACTGDVLLEVRRGVTSAYCLRAPRPREGDDTCNRVEDGTGEGLVTRCKDTCAKTEEERPILICGKTPHL